MSRIKLTVEQLDRNVDAAVDEFLDAIAKEASKMARVVDRNMELANQDNLPPHLVKATIEHMANKLQGTLKTVIRDVGEEQQNGK